MIARQTVYLDADRKPVLVGKDARSLLVRQGCEISQALAERYGAVELIGGTREAPRGVQTQEPAVQTRDPEAAKSAPGGKRG